MKIVIKKSPAGYISIGNTTIREELMMKHIFLMKKQTHI